jgi:hypothetical protein
MNILNNDKNHTVYFEQLSLSLYAETPGSVLRLVIMPSCFCSCESALVLLELRISLHMSCRILSLEYNNSKIYYTACARFLLLCCLFWR